MKLRVVQEGKNLPKCNPIFWLIAEVAICMMIIPIAFCHVCTWLYQEIYFSIYKIPKVRLREFLAVDRGQLKSLNWYQKIACVYCGYANAATAWFKAVTNQTEIYSCAIKHNTMKKGQEHQKEFYAYEEFK